MPQVEADVIVVGAGPAGSTTAVHAARAGLEVVLLEKSRFPRAKVCGDGLTPRAVRQLVRMGVDTTPAAGWSRNKGLRIHGGPRGAFTLDWPDLADFPDYGLTRRRSEFDQLLARHALAQGARLGEGVTVTGLIRDERTGRVKGVRAGEDEYLAPVVVAADGNSSRLGVAAGRERRTDRPMGVAVRTYYRSPRHDDDYLDSFLQLWDGRPGASNLLPGYGWSFPMGDGVCNVGLGMLDTSKAFGRVDYRKLLRAWLDGTPAEWGFVEENQLEPVRGAALPMCFNRQPAYADGLALVGDAAGLVSPFNGEGIAYAMESGEMLAQTVADASQRGFGSPSAERALAGYPSSLRASLGGYFRLGSVFVKLIGNPQVMRVCTRYGLPRRTLMRFVHKLLANLTDSRDGDAMDKIINALATMAPSV